MTYAMTTSDYAEKLKLLSGMAMLLQSCEQEDELFDVTYWYLPRLFPDSPGSILLVSENSEMLGSVFSWPDSETKPFHPVSTRCPAFLAGSAVDTRTADPAGCRECGSGGYCLPFREGRESFGLFCLTYRPKAELSAADKGLAYITTEYLSLAISNIRLKKRLKEMSIRDPLTRLYNRRYMDDVTTREIRRARRSGSNLGMIMTDLDHFKQLNDTHGHHAGDEVLRRVAEALSSRVRAEDMVCRFGGEEFFILMPSGGSDGTLNRAEDLRQTIASLSISWKGKPVGPISASFGVAVFPDHGQTLDDILKMADKALYAAKSRGRNQVVSAEDIPDGRPS